MSWRVFGVLAAVVVVGGVLAGAALCQEAGGGGGGGGRGGMGGGRGNFDPAQMRQTRIERTKQALGATDEEWQALGPMVEKVQELSGQLSSRGMGMRGAGRGRGGDQGGGPPGSPAAQQPQTPLQKAEAALQETLANASAANADITAKLTALRDAREKVKQELAVAQDELRKVITLRQEAQLVLMGLLN
jgi:hypothetical protein